MKAAKSESHIFICVICICEGRWRKVRGEGKKEKIEKKGGEE
jgi:hypothetical protein